MCNVAASDLCRVGRSYLPGGAFHALRELSMKKIILAAVSALALAVALPAAASTFITESAPAADGSITWDFGNTGGIPAGAFDDVFDILFPVDGLGAGSVTATFTSKTTEL